MPIKRTDLIARVPPEVEARVRSVRDQLQQVDRDAPRAECRLMFRTQEESEENRSGAKVPAKVEAGYPAVLKEQAVNRATIRLYWGVIGLVSEWLGCAVEDLAIVVLTHELAHAYTQLGADIEGRASAQGDIVPWLNATADKLQVTATALKWRLVALNRLDAARAREISDEVLRFNGHDGPIGEPPPLFSKSFMEVLGQTVNEGRISARRATILLDLTIDDLANLFARHAVEAPLDL